MLRSFIDERSTLDERQLFSEKVKAKVVELGGDNASALEGEAAARFLAFMEAEAEEIAGV